MSASLCTVLNCATRGLAGHGVTCFRAIVNADGPLSLITASAPGPAGVAMATIVSSSEPAALRSGLVTVNRRENETTPRFQDFHRRVQGVIPQRRTQTIDCVESC